MYYYTYVKMHNKVSHYNNYFNYINCIELHMCMHEHAHACTHAYKTNSITTFVHTHLYIRYIRM